MPALKSPRHEAMAQLLAQGKTQTVAYVEAGFRGKSSSAPTQVANTAPMQARVQELVALQHHREAKSNERAIELAGMDKVYVTTRLKYVIDRSVRGTKPVYNDKGEVASWLPSAGDNRAAIDGLKLAAQMGGFLIEKLEIGGPGDFSRMTDDELNRELITIGGNIGLDESAIQKAIGYYPEEAK